MLALSSSDNTTVGDTDETEMRDRVVMVLSFVTVALFVVGIEFLRRIVGRGGREHDDEANEGAGGRSGYSKIAMVDVRRR